MPSRRGSESVFVNCPFDKRFRKLFDAVVFAVFDCGYTPRCTLEIEDSSRSRIDKLYDLVEQSRLGIHDISRTQLDSAHRLPRFNMPFELGLFLGAKRFGSRRQRAKACVILDTEPYRFQRFLSDIAGQDIKAHGNRVAGAIGVVRNWLASVTRARPIPGGSEICRRYLAFRRDLPALCRRLRLDVAELTFGDYSNLVALWLEEQSRLARG